MKGVSLVETILVVALIALLSGLSAFFYAKFLTQNTVVNNADQIVGLIRKAQAYSMAGKQGGAWGVKSSASPKRVVLYLQNNTSFDEYFSINQNISITAFDILFGHFSGLPNTQPVITVQSDNNVETITINSQGVVDRN